MVLFLSTYNSFLTLSPFLYRSRMVSTIYFNGMKMYTELHDTPNGLNKWFAGGKWFLGKSVVFKRYF